MLKNGVIYSFTQLQLPGTVFAINWVGCPVSVMGHMLLSAISRDIKYM